MKLLNLLFIVCLFSVNTTLSQIFYHSNPGVSKPLVNQLGYKTPQFMSHDSNNRPYMVSYHKRDEDTLQDLYKIWTIRNGQWVEYSFLDELQVHFGDDFSLETIFIENIVIDNNDNFYMLMTTLDKNILIYGRNVAASTFNGDFKIYTLPEGKATMETWSSANDFSQYPPLISITRYSKNEYVNTVPWASGNTYIHLILSITRNSDNSITVPQNLIYVDDKTISRWNILEDAVMLLRKGVRLISSI